MERRNTFPYFLTATVVRCIRWWCRSSVVPKMRRSCFRILNRYKGECRFSTWIYRIAYNAAISATRKKKQEFLYIEENTINNVPDEMADNVLAPAETEEQLVRLGMAIDQLSGEEKALITLFYYEEKSMEEIGEVLKLSISNVKVRLHRTRKKICVLMNNK